MKKLIRQALLLGISMLLFTGCGFMTSESVKVRDLEFTILSSSLIPEELTALLEEKGGEPFQFTFRDKDNLYICIGYGARDTQGYQIVVEELYLTEGAIHVSTTLLGPKEKGETAVNNPTIVIKTENLQEPVIYR